jgi:hypothetical protein
MKARTDIAWVDGSVRPYESIWSVLQRFFSMNVISSTTFAKEFFTTGWFTEISTSILGNPVAFDYKKFCLALGIDSSISDKMDLRYLRAAFLGIEDRRLKYCPLCIQHYYHSVFFQLKDLKTCPLHKVELIHTCFHCKRELDCNIQASNVKNPYSCRSCQAKFLNGSQMTLLHLPNLDGLDSFKDIDDWCDYAITVPRGCAIINSKREMATSKWFYPIYQSLSKRDIPKLLKQHANLNEFSRLQYSCGIKPSTSSSDKSKFLSEYLMGQAPLPNLAPIFKAYRRYLMKVEVGNWGKRSTQSMRWDWTLSLEPQNLKLFAIQRLTQRIKDLSQSVVPQNAKRYIYITINFSSVYDALKSCKNSEEAEWVIYHAYFEELSCMYQEALSRSQEMISNNNWMNYHSLTATGLPCSFIVRNEKGKLIFNTIQTESYIQAATV